jgi:hypothetical protein
LSHCGQLADAAEIEEARWVRDPGRLAERELHDVLVRLPGADNPVAARDRIAPFPLVGYLGDEIAMRNGQFSTVLEPNQKRLKWLSMQNLTDAGNVHRRQTNQA